MGYNFNVVKLYYRKAFRFFHFKKGNKDFPVKIEDHPLSPHLLTLSEVLKDYTTFPKIS